MRNSKNVPRGTFIFKILLLCIVFIPFLTPSFEAVAYPYLVGSSNLLMDADTGVIYLNDNIDEQLGIASLTKLMSLYIVFEEMDAQGLKKTDKVTISSKVVNMKLQNESISGVYYQEGEVLTMGELIDLALIYSDNGATIALAEKVSGSESKHVQKMNDKAEELGMTNSIFYNVSGLTMSDYGDYMLEGTKATDYNKSSARDLGILTYHLLKEYPEVLDVTSKASVTYQGYDYSSFNQMLEGMPYEYEGIKGLKTGTTNEAGECFVSYYEGEERNYVTVSLHVEPDDYTNRFTEAAMMLDWANEQEYIELATTDEPIVDYNIKGDTKGSVDLYVQNNISILKTDGIYYSLEKETLNSEYFDEDGYLKKEIPKGGTVLTLSFKTPKDSISMQSVLTEEDTLKIELVAKDDIKEQNIFLKFISSFGYFIEDVIN